MEYSSERAKKKKVMNVIAPTVHSKLPDNIVRTDAGPTAITPWRDLPKEPVDLAHMVVSGTGSPFIMPTDVPKPHRPRSPRRITQIEPAGHTKAEKQEMPKHPLYF